MSFGWQENSLPIPTGSKGIESIVIHFERGKRSREYRLEAVAQVFRVAGLKALAVA